MNSTPRSYSRQTGEALALLGGQIRLARKQRKLTAADLASRVGIARSTLQLIESGNPKAEIGLVFEAATLVGVPLFAPDQSTLQDQISRVNDRLALLPQSVRQSREEVDDDF